MKLILVINNAFSAFHLRGAVKHFVDKGWDVAIISTPGPLLDELVEKEGGRILPISLSRDISPFHDLYSLWQIVRILRREKPDVINVGSPKTGFLFALAKMLLPSIPVIFTLRGIRSDTLTGWKKSVVFYTERLACRKADKVIVISPSLREHAVSIGMLQREKAVLLGAGSSNGIDTERFSKQPEYDRLAAKWRTEYRMGPDDLVIAHVGRVTKDKGIAEVYEAFTRLEGEFPNLQWMVVGPVEKEDPVDPEIMRAMEDHPRIHMPGQIDDIPPIYALCDVLVLYSYREGFGNVVLQASAMGKPVVVADIPGCRDTVEEGVTGLRVAPANPDALTDALRTYLSDEQLRKAHGEAGRIRAERDFKSEVIWAGQEELYKELAR